MPNDSGRTHTPTDALRDFAEHMRAHQAELLRRELRAELEELTAAVGEFLKTPIGPPMPPTAVPPIATDPNEQETDG